MTASESPRVRRLSLWRWDSVVMWVPCFLFIHAATLWLRPLASWFWEMPSSPGGDGQFLHVMELITSGEWTRWSGLIPAASLSLWTAWCLRPKNMKWPETSRLNLIAMSLTCGLGLIALRELNGGLLNFQARYFPHFEVMSWWIMAWVIGALWCGAHWTTPVVWRGACAILGWGYFAAAWAKLSGMGWETWLEGGVIEHLVSRWYLVSDASLARALLESPESLETLDWQATSFAPQSLPIFSLLAAATLCWELLAPIGFLHWRLQKIYCAVGIAFHLGVWQAGGINFVWPWAMLYVVVFADRQLASAAHFNCAQVTPSPP